MPAKQKLSQRKALRSAAARKGWETRRREADARWADFCERHKELRGFYPNGAPQIGVKSRSAEPVQSDPIATKHAKIIAWLRKLVGR